MHISSFEFLTLVNQKCKYGWIDHRYILGKSVSFPMEYSVAGKDKGFGTRLPGLDLHYLDWISKLCFQ